MTCVLSPSALSSRLFPCPSPGRFLAPFSCSNAVALGCIEAPLIQGLHSMSYSEKQVLATKKSLEIKKDDAGNLRAEIL